MKKIILTAVLFFLFISSVSAAETSLINDVTKSLVISGFAAHYSGCGFMLAGMPFLIGGAVSGNIVLTGFGIAFESIGLISVFFVGPILSIVANYTLMNDGVIESRVANYPGFWYGMGWASGLVGLVLWVLSFTLGPITDMPLAGAVALYVISGICIAASIGFMSASVTIPFAFTVKLF